MVLVVLLSFIYIKFMDWCAYTLSWVTVILMQCSLVAIGLLAFFERKNMMLQPGYDETTATALEWTVWTSWIMAGIYYLVMACNFKSLRVSIAIIETAADFFADTKRIIFIPVLYFCVGTCVFIAWLYGLVCVSSIGAIVADNVNLQTKTVERTEGTNWMIAGMVMGLIWILAFIVAMNEFVVITSSATWYFSRKDIPDADGIPGDSDIWKGMWWSFRYHIGSLAFGSFILTVIWLIRITFEYLGNKVD